MKYCNEEFSFTYEEKKSKFIAYLCPFRDFKETMKKLKVAHPKARHFVYAYRHLNENNQIVENSSDDGEPRGTSGKPTLNVLAGYPLINTCVIIIRYFGGVKLGTGGLVRAYSSACNLVINEASLFQYVNLIEKSLILPYKELQKCEYLCKQFSINILSKEFNNDVTLRLEATKENFISLENKLIQGLELM
ncbi:MAG: YigZ family protein [Campylobacteraceae bacterium]|nr:YigZ family protein [Campylobacteraceae bacterium]